jgi:hypothetical protein
VDLGSTLKVVLTACNSVVATPAASAPTATVQAAPPRGTVGKTTVGANLAGPDPDVKRVNVYTLSSNTTVSKLTI